ncbi:MAG TPA: helix-turn-helix domain-containing protein [Candidatus Limnocylindria bacterium]|nr:helix-turn-helix domain-containing protein [Candidatus Limnocylindria bacterium]
MIFEQKKIQIETLSEYLIAVRQSFNFSVEEVSKKTGIKLKFLESLEKGEFKILPADVYVLGFLTQLAALYAINPGELIGQYKKEKGIAQQLSRRAQFLESAWYKKPFNKLVITPKILSLTVGLVFVLLTVGYIIWQVWSINKTPSLQILSPVDNAVAQSSEVEIRGKTDPGMTATVNGQNIFVDSKGAFETQLGLSPGPKEIVVVASNHFGKSVTKTINITGAAENQTASPQLILKVDFTGTVILGFVIDNEPLQTLHFSNGDSKTFVASQEILLSTSNAGATKVTVNGQILGPMGKPKEQLNSIPFFPPVSGNK